MDQFLREQPSVPVMALAFLRLGAQAWGGQAVTIALLERDFAERRGWLASSDITQVLTYANLLPGSTNVQVVAFLGWRLHGWAGMLTAAVAFLLPSFLVMLGFAAAYHLLRSLHGVSAALQGLTAAAVGLIAATMLTLGRKTLQGWDGVAVAALVFLGSVRLHLNPALLVALAGLLGVVREAGRTRA